MPMSPRLLRPRATAGYGVDALDWRNRVIANGGSVSAATLKAVDTFCRSIVTNNLRDRFYRLNLFAGDNLSACLVPLFRGPSLTGTQFGNTTDTNVNFVSGDYSEASSGLTGNGTNKYLQTGVTVTNIGVNSGHMAWYTSRNTLPASTQTVLGAVVGTGRGWAYYTSVGINGQYGINVAFGGASAVAGTVIVQRDLTLSSNSAKIFTNGTVAFQGLGAATGSDTSGQFFVFATNQSTGISPTQHASGDLRAYSLGSALTDSQAAAYSNAMQAFQLAIGRSVL